MTQDARFHTLTLRVKDGADENRVKEIQELLASMPAEEILAGLRFAQKRWNAKKGGFLMVGRKSKIRREVQLLTPEQARWRLKNWKMMIKNYREHGYSYPTISRIKKTLQNIADSK